MRAVSGRIPAGSRTRISVQLSDGLSGSPVWAERYDRTIEDIFAVQDEITLVLATEMQVKLTEGEQARLQYTTTSNVEALTLEIAESLLPSKQAIAISDPAFASIFGSHSTLDVPVLYALVVVVLMHVMLTKTGLGYRIQAVGANRRAAPLVGINVRWTKFWVLTISGTAGVLLAGFFQAGYSQLAKGYDLDALGAAVIGGTALFGGRGNVIASISGVLVLAVLNWMDG